MKTVLVIDIPNDIKVKDLFIDYQLHTGFKDGENGWKVRQFIEEKKDVELRALPKKKGNTIYRIVGTYEDGYNACLKEITGETE